MNVIFKEKAIDSIANIAFYISKKSFEERAYRFADRLYDFGNSLNNFPDKYPLCRFKMFAQRNLHCAVFENTYIFVYKVIKSELVIFDAIHGKRLI